MAHLCLSLLGPFQATLGGVPIASFESDKVRALLAYLAVEAEQPQRRERLAGLLWPDRPEHSSRNNLRYALSNLREPLATAIRCPLSCSLPARRFSSTARVMLQST